MNNGRLFFFNRFVHPDHSATSQLLSDLAFHLAGQGRNVTLVGCPQRYDDAAAVSPPREVIDGVEVLRVGGTRFGRNSLPGRALDYLSYLLGAMRLLLVQVKPGDTVVLMTDPPLLGAVLGPLANWRGARSVHWLQDLFPEVAEVLLGGIWRRPIGPMLRWWRNRGLRRAHRVVAISTGMAARLQAAGVAAANIQVIPNWTDDRLIQPLAASDNPLRRAWSLESQFVVGYSGNLGRAHDWRTMLQAALSLRERADIRFLLIGGGAGMQAFVSEAERLGLTQVEIRPYLPRESLAQSLALPDLHWLSLDAELEGTILPSKLYGILAAGRPLLFIGKTDGEVARQLQSAGCGVAIACGDVQSTVQAIQDLAADAALRSLMGRKARAWLDANGTKQASLDGWDRLLGDSVR